MSKVVKPTIGVLALQGDFREHITSLEAAGYPAIPVRTISEAEQTAGLIIPGGESTAIGKLLRSTKLDAWIIKRVKQGYPVYGTCAGCVLLAKTVDSEYSLQLIDITAQRNAFGRQVDSFETPLTFQGNTITGMFIRAPRILKTHDTTETLIAYDKEPVLVRQKTILAGTFHPELSDSIIIHKYFGAMVEQATAKSNS